MITKSLLFIGLLTGATFTGAGFLSYDEAGRPEVQEKQLMVVFRDIGHTILLKAGDSTSRVMPVKKIDPRMFQLEFESQFKFVPDTLVKLVHDHLATGHLPLNYIVNVIECSTNLVIYGYQIGPGQKTLVPCRGRTQPAGCYSIQITFLENPVKTSNAKLFIGLAVMAIAFVGYVVIGRTKVRQQDQPSDDVPFVPLGTYSFYEERRMLKKGNVVISLTDKESKLLSVLVANQNIPMNRDQLLKKVWEDDGVFVGRSLDVFISKLRKKLQGDSTVRIVNIHGVGYKLEV